MHIAPISGWRRWGSYGSHEVTPRGRPAVPRRRPSWAGRAAPGSPGLGAPARALRVSPWRRGHFRPQQDWGWWPASARLWRGQRVAGAAWPLRTEGSGASGRLPGVTFPARRWSSRSRACTRADLSRAWQGLARNSRYARVRRSEQPASGVVGPTPPRGRGSPKVTGGRRSCSSRCVLPAAWPLRGFHLPRTQTGRGYPPV